MDTASKQPVTSSPLPSGSGKVATSSPKRSHVLLFSFIILALLTIGALVLTLLNLQQKQGTTSKATDPEICYNGSPPLPIDPLCVEGRHVRCTDLQECNRPVWENLCRGKATLAVLVSEAGEACKDQISLGCPRPREGYCKEKSPNFCYECQFEDGRGFQTSVCPCTQPTVTPPTKVSCPLPNQCLPKESCDPLSVTNTSALGSCPIAGQSCCKPKTKVVCESPFQCLPAEECVPDSLNPQKEATLNSCAAAGTVCCVKKQKVTPTPGNCPLPEAISGVKVTCPNCTK